MRLDASCITTFRVLCSRMLDLDALAKRFYRWVDKSAGSDACWIWRGALAGGYGLFACYNPHGHSRSFRAHRVAYLLRHGAIDDALVLDHLCSIRECVNPAHLEAVTHGENLRRAHSPTSKAARAAASRVPGRRRALVLEDDDRLRVVDRLAEVREALRDSYPNLRASRAQDIAKVLLNLAMRDTRLLRRLGIRGNARIAALMATPAARATWGVPSADGSGASAAPDTAVPEPSPPASPSAPDAPLAPAPLVRRAS